MTGSRLTLRVNPEVAEFLHGEENRLVPNLERKIGKQIVIYPDSRYHMEAFDIIESLGKS
jgi:ribonuclease G